MELQVQAVLVVQTVLQELQVQVVVVVVQEQVVQVVQVGHQVHQELQENEAQVEVQTTSSIQVLLR
jgi:hypothetical protein